MTRPRKKLVLLGKVALVVALVVAVLAAGPLVAGALIARALVALPRIVERWNVRSEQRDLEDRTFRLDFATTPEQTAAVTGRQHLGEVWRGFVFAEPLRFKRIGETIEAYGYEAVTFADPGGAHTGEYAMRATLRKGYTGGPPGFATEYVVDVEDVRLIRKLAPPKAPPGKRGVVPGEVVIRLIPDGKLERVDDRYLIELPAKVGVSIWFDPSPDEYNVELSVTRDGSAVPLRYHDHAEQFETVSAGIYELRVRPAEPSASREPDRYSFNIVWGHSSIAGDLPGRQIRWRAEGRSSGSSGR
jgi:hypothetical protein